tara:strand:- start:682 stop:1230 length:549 start_codon:yes stop_codon:yes gene_type:complete
MKLEECIVVLNNIVKQDFIDIIIKYIDKKATGKMSTVGGLKEDTRNVYGHSLRKDNVSDKIFFRHIDHVIKDHYTHYKVKFPCISPEKIAQIDLLKYTHGGKYEIHTDESAKCWRTLTCILNLNEEYEGGDFVVYAQDGKTEMKRIKCKTGTCIMFPSNFLFPHRVEPITSGERYSIVTWLT